MVSAIITCVRVFAVCLIGVMADFVLIVGLHLVSLPYFIMHCASVMQGHASHQFHFSSIPLICEEIQWLWDSSHHRRVNK